MFAVKKTFATSSRSRWFSGIVGRPGAAWLTLLMVTVGLAAPVAAQRYTTIEPKMDIKAARALKNEMSAAMRNAAAFQSNGKKVIDQYFKTDYFPRMTQANPGALAELGKRREDLVKLLRGAAVPAAQAHLTDLTLGVMRVLTRGNYHPAVRYNAALIVGMLDKTYADGATPPVVLPAATNELLELLEQNEFKGIKVHPAVKVGAMEGLERHVRFGLDAQYGERVTKATLAVLAQEPSAMNVKADVNNWLKCQAAGVLARQFKEGPNQEVQAALTQLIANSKMDLDDRCCVAGLLEMIAYAPAAGADAAATIVPLGMLTKEVVAEGAEEAREFEDLFVPGGRTRTFRPPPRGRRGDEGPKLERRQLVARLMLIEKGVSSLSNGLADEEKQKVQSLSGLLKPVIENSVDKKMLDLDIAGEVIKLKDSVDNMVASWQPAAAPAAAASADAEFAE